MRTSTGASPKNIMPGRWSQPLEEGEAAPRPGILVSEELLWRYVQSKIENDELYDLHASHNSVWSAQRNAYEESRKRDKQTIYDLQPSWWDAHKFDLALAGGFVLGAVAAVAILAAQEEVQQNGGF